ncbi:MAG: hypothetical protein HY241_09270 [Actinobacteria bacterium]|nr:hypothetical protein [Actinomycetota bacterium]
MENGKRDVIVVALHDGWYGCGTGAGHSNRRVLEILDRLVPASIPMIVLPVRLRTGTPHHRGAWERESLAWVRTNARDLRAFGWCMGLKVLVTVCDSGLGHAWDRAVVPG